MVRAFVAGWNLTRPPAEGGRFAQAGTRTVAFVGAVAWLEQESGVPSGTIQNLLGAAGPRNQTTELRIADALTAAIGRPDVLTDGEYPTNEGGTLVIRPNPIAPKASRAACCGGSQDGLTELNGLMTAAASRR